VSQVSPFILALLVAAVVSYVLTPLVRRFAIKVGAMRKPRDRDVHVKPIPRLGGLAMFAGLAAGLLVAEHLGKLSSAFDGTHILGSLLLAGGLMVLIGAIDDRWGMNWISKLAAQVAAGAILVVNHTEIAWIPLPHGQIFIPTPNQSMLLTILMVVATVNAVNFIDGLDGLAAGIVAIAAVSFFFYYYSLAIRIHLPGGAGPALASAVLAGVCLGFLPHNFYPARLFMGDSGSYLLGLVLAYAPILAIASIPSRSLTDTFAYHAGAFNRFAVILPLLLPAAILIIPYADMGLAVVRRTRAGMSPFAPDRKHLHHRLLDIGHSHRSSVLIMYLWAALFSGTVVFLSIVKTQLFVFGIITAVAVLALILMSMPRLRWWRRAKPAGRPAGRPPGPARAAAGPAAQDQPRTASQPALPATGQEPATASAVRLADAPVPADDSRTAAAPTANGTAPDSGGSGRAAPDSTRRNAATSGGERAGSDGTGSQPAGQQPRSVVGTPPPGLDNAVLAGPQSAAADAQADLLGSDSGGVHGPAADSGEVLGGRSPRADSGRVQEGRPARAETLPRREPAASTRHAGQSPWRREPAQQDGGQLPRRVPSSSARPASSLPRRQPVWQVSQPGWQVSQPVPGRQPDPSAPPTRRVRPDWRRNRPGYAGPRNGEPWQPPQRPAVPPGQPPSGSGFDVWSKSRPADPAAPAQHDNGGDAGSGRPASHGLE
jgi:UDP-GlcNAc:undecaprenyl-phosphate GlcNAc-1-phosphate transferase